MIVGGCKKKRGLSAPFLLVFVVLLLAVLRRRDEVALCLYGVFDFFLLFAAEGICGFLSLQLRQEAFACCDHVVCGRFVVLLSRAVEQQFLRGSAVLDLLQHVQEFDI